MHMRTLSMAVLKTAGNGIESKTSNENVNNAHARRRIKFNQMLTYLIWFFRMTSLLGIHPGSMGHCEGGDGLAQDGPAPGRDRPPFAAATSLVFLPFEGRVELANVHACS